MGEEEAISDLLYTTVVNKELKIAKLSKIKQ